MDSYEMLADNYLKIFQYQKAAQTYSFILEKFKSRLDSAKIADYQNYTKFRALSEVPPQTTSIKEKSIIERQGGRVPIHFGQQVFPLGFDTGANFSIITASLADKFGFKIIDETIEVSSITGDKIDASFGVSPEMTIGKATISNAIFLVFEDKHLYITEADHQINGVIGFPVISALKEITFLKSGEIIVPAKPGSAHNQNMCLDELTPLIAGKYKGNRLIFSFDTGANKSDLYPPFFEAYKDEIADNFSSFTKTLRGVGSRREVKAYRMEDFEIEFSGKKAYFSEIPVLTEPTIESSRYLYGNLGRDLVNQFEKMNLNFVSMSLVFE
ncbi:hypothetical protein GWN91_00890 [Candidatus Saccharibacteria bacterium]|nr:hypothetical protein [Candidatus Saccharibacteria bacterium]NIV71361.1 hypothetical protein [Calditrichia bacterium]